MQTLSQIKALLSSAGAAPRKRLGQVFLIDRNLMGKLLSLAEVEGEAPVLEVGAATGSLTEELLSRCGRVVAVEKDPRLAAILRARLGDRQGLTVIQGDVLSGKHALAPAVLDALAGAERARLVANLPYSVAVPVILNCLVNSWRAACRPGPPAVRFDRLTVTVQRELAERLLAPVGSGSYGPASVVVALLSRPTPGRVLPPHVFWPRPKVDSQMLRLDFDPDAAAAVADAAQLSAVLAAAFAHRRKKLSTTCRTRGFPFAREAFLAAAGEAGIDPGERPHRVAPEGFRALANALGPRNGGPGVVEC